MTTTATAPTFTLSNMEDVLCDHAEICQYQPFWPAAVARRRPGSSQVKVTVPCNYCGYCLTGWIGEEEADDEDEMADYVRELQRSAVSVQILTDPDWQRVIQGIKPFIIICTHLLADPTGNLYITPRDFNGKRYDQVVCAYCACQPDQQRVFNECRIVDRGLFLNDDDLRDWITEMYAEQRGVVGR